MAPRKKFARTWWGGRWLEALEILGRFWPNRLPRGRSYARRGAVKEISIAPASITAAVQGTRRKPYQVRIKIRPFSKEEKKALFQTLKTRTFLVSSLLRLEMPEELLSHLAAQGLKLIPNHPDEFETHCSCPDWANPCKHIAAVFYTLTQAIDSDPFNLFLFRGIPREEVLKNLELAQGSEEEKRESRGYFEPSPKAIIRFSEFRTKGSLPPLIIPEGPEDLIFSLLSAEPPFYTEGDLRQELRKLYRASRALVLEEITGLGEDLSLKPSQEAVYLPGKKNLFVCHQTKRGHRVWLPREARGRLVGRRLSGLRLSLKEILPWLLACSLEEEGLSPALKVYVYLAHFSWVLVTQGHFIPEVYRERDAFWLRFRPYYAFAEVKKIFQEVCHKAPLSSFLQGESHSYLTPEEVLGNFLTEAVDFLVRHAAQGINVPALFLRRYHPLAGPVDEAFFQGLSAWLAPLKAPEKGKKGALSLLLKQARKYWYLSPLFRNKPLARVFSKLSLSERKDLLETLGILIRSFPVLSELENRNGLQERVRLTTQDLLHFLHLGRGLLKALDIPVVVAGKLKLVERLKLKGSSTKGVAAGEGQFSLDKILRFDLKVALEDKELSFEELRKLLHEEAPLLRIKDEFYLLAPEELTRLKKALVDRDILQGPQALLAMLAGEVSLGGETFSFEPPPEIKTIFKRLQEELPTLYPPKLVKARLRPYQLRGFRWLVSTLQAGFGACLADDMGLGKTLQTICALAYLWEQGRIKKALVVAPTTLLGNWQEEFRRFAPEISTALYHGPNRKLEKATVTITSYGTLRSDQDELVEQGFDLVVLDEAQNIKNPAAAQTQAVYRLARAPFRLALSGTPVENSLLELWSIFRFLNPGLLGSQQEFLRRFVRPIEFLGDQEASDRLRQVIGPFVLRREKKDPTIVPDLPKKIEKDEWCLLTPLQAALYQRVLDEVMQRIRSTKGMERRGLVLKLITLLKQICNHPALYHKHRTGEPEESGKFARLLELLQEIRAQREKVLIFSQFRSMGEIICHGVEKLFGESPFFLHGGVPRKKREEMIALFEKGKTPFVFVLSLKAGGTGLNLVSATHVIHYDLWWNPAVEAQATDRAYRIGQKQTVMVHRLLTRHTLEEKINELLLKKRDLASSIVSAEEKWITELSDQELQALVSLG